MVGAGAEATAGAVDLAVAGAEVLAGRQDFIQERAPHGTVILLITTEIRIMRTLILDIHIPLR